MDTEFEPDRVTKKLKNEELTRRIRVLIFLFFFLVCFFNVLDFSTLLFFFFSTCHALKHGSSYRG